MFIVLTVPVLEGFPVFCTFIVAVFPFFISCPEALKVHSFILNVAAFEEPTLAYKWLPLDVELLPVKVQLVRFTVAVVPDPVKLVFMAMAPPFPLLLTELLVNAQFDIVNVAPLPTVIAPP